jgi:hypothetical protein
VTTVPGPEEPRYFAVVVPDGELPETLDADSADALAESLVGLAGTPGTRVYVFRGARLGVTRGGRWLVVDDRRISLMPPPDPALEQIDESGAVGDWSPGLSDALPPVFLDDFGDQNGEDSDRCEDDEDEFLEGPEGGEDEGPEGRGADAGGW